MPEALGFSPMSEQSSLQRVQLYGMEANKRALLQQQWRNCLSCTILTRMANVSLASDTVVGARLSCLALADAGLHPLITCLAARVQCLHHAAHYPMLLTDRGSRTTGTGFAPSSLSFAANPASQSGSRRRRA